jgi:hypothetical protein
MVDPPFERDVLCFEGRIRGDVPRHVFGPNDFFRKQIKAKRKDKEKVKRKITRESKRQVKGKLTLESCVSLGRCPPWVACPCPWLWGFLFWSRGEDEKCWMSVRVDLQGILAGYFID